MTERWSYIFHMHYLTHLQNLNQLAVFPCHQDVSSTIMSTKISFISKLHELELLDEHCEDFRPYLQLISNFKQQSQSLKLSHNNHLKSLYQLKGKCHQIKLWDQRNFFSTKQNGYSMIPVYYGCTLHMLFKK